MEEPGVFVPFDSKPRTEVLTPKRKTFGVRVLEALNGSAAQVQLVRMQRAVFLYKIMALMRILMSVALCSRGGRRLAHERQAPR